MSSLPHGIGAAAPATPPAPAAPAHADLGGLQPRLLMLGAVAGWLPPFVGNRLRMVALQAAGFRIGRGTVIWGMPTIVGSGDITSRLRIGVVCGFNVGCFFELEAPITIGDRVAIGHDVMFLTRSYEVGPATQRAGAVVRAPIVVEDGAWLGARCTIMPGVTIGAGSVIGAGMAISKDVPPNTLLMGNQKISLAKWR